MKNLSLSILLTLTITYCFASCGNDDSPVLNETEVTPPVTNPSDGSTNITTNKMKITVGNSVFNVTLSDNPSVTAFKSLLPLTLNMNELNNNEKVFQLQTSLPTNASPGGNIQVGDFMLYGNNALVLFYESFSTSYTYTRLGKVDDISGYKAALGTGNVTVKFELQP